MKTTQRRVICWNCEELFYVDIPEMESTTVVVTRSASKATQTQKPKQKLIVKCPKCGKENDLRVG